MVAQDGGVRGAEGLDFSKDNGRENECSQENDDGEGTYNALLP